MKSVEALILFTVWHGITNFNVCHLIKYYVEFIKFLWTNIKSTVYKWLFYDLADFYQGKHFMKNKLCEY